MSLQKFVTEFQDYLFNQLPLFDRLHIKYASKTDYFGAHKNAESLLEEYKENLDFIEKNAITAKEEVIEILDSFDKKLDKINLFATTLIGLNSTEDSSKEVLTVKPYILSELQGWENIEQKLLLPIKSTNKPLKAYSTYEQESKGFSRFRLSDEYSAKYLSISKKYTTQLSSITYLDSVKEEISTTSFTETLNRDNVIIECPPNAKYFLIDFYKVDEENLVITPLTYKHVQKHVSSLPTSTYAYGDILSFNNSVELPYGCYTTLSLMCSFKDINNRVVSVKSFEVPLNNDGFVIKEKAEGKVKGIWLDGFYSEDIASKDVEGAYYVVENTLPDGVSAFTESSVRFNIKNAVTIDVTPSLFLYSLASDTQTPRINYLTGMTKNV